MRLKRCQSQCKDTNFKANHNTSDIFNLPSVDVSLNAKIRILKQITTLVVAITKIEKMLVSMQRYEF